jgi:hypothetical protein
MDGQVSKAGSSPAAATRQKSSMLVQWLEWMVTVLAAQDDEGEVDTYMADWTFHSSNTFTKPGNAG